MSTYTLHILPSISTGRIISGLAGGLKLLWTNVSSKSKTNVFLPLAHGFYSPQAAKCGGNGSLPNF